MAISMEVAKSGRKKMNLNVIRDEDFVGPKRNQHHYVTSIEENEKIVEEMQQQMLQLEIKLKPKTNLNHQMLHKAHCMNGERRLLMMLNPNKDIDSGLTVEEQIEEQIYEFGCSLGWPYLNSTNAVDGETYIRKIKELECEKDKVFAIAPPKATIWNSLPSTKELRSRIQDTEAIYGKEKRKTALMRREKIESMERQIKKAENEVKSTKRMMEIIRKRNQSFENHYSHRIYFNVYIHIK